MGLLSLDSHWDKVDNYRIDKYLMLIRYLVRSAFYVLLYRTGGKFKESKSEALIELCTLFREMLECEAQGISL